jgi:hypothetical protein
MLLDLLVLGIFCIDGNIFCLKEYRTSLMKHISRAGDYYRVFLVTFKDNIARFVLTRRVHVVALWVEALCYKPEGHGFDSRLSPWYFKLISCLPYSSILKTEAICSSDALVNCHRMHGPVSQKVGRFGVDINIMNEPLQLTFSVVVLNTRTKNVFLK